MKRSEFLKLSEAYASVISGKSVSESSIEEGYFNVIVRDAKGKVKSEKQFKDKNAAQKHVDRIKQVNKVGDEAEIVFVKEQNLPEEKVECPKCEGEGCKHCDGKGYHETDDDDDDEEEDDDMEEGYIGAKGEKGRDFKNSGKFDKDTAYAHAKKHNGVVHADGSGKYLVKHGKGKHVSEATVEVCESCGKVHEGKCSPADVASKKDKTESQMDPVNKKELKKGFKDRGDKDIDNDGDVDSSDKYLHKRRQAVSKAVKKEGVDLDLEGALNELFSMLEKVDQKKGATPPEGLLDKESPKSKEFVAKHEVEVQDEEETHETAVKAGRATTAKSGKRPQDNQKGDNKIIKSTEAPAKNQVKEGSESLIDQARETIAGEKKKYDGRYKEAKAFLERMAKRKGWKKED